MGGANRGAYAGSRLKIDLSGQSAQRLPGDPRRQKLYLGGRGEDAKILFDSLKPGRDPLHPESPLCFSAGPLVGLLGPSTGRVNVAAISPMTGIYGNANAGANWGAELKYAGYDGIEISGRAERPVYLYIQDDAVELRDASDLMGKGVFDATKALKAALGEGFRVATIGQAAENGVLFASVVFDFWDIAARTGMGAVMAGKNLKAIAVKGTGELKVARPQLYAEVMRECWEAVRQNPGYRSGAYSKFGTAATVDFANAAGWLATKNFINSSFEGAHKINGESFRDKYSTKGTTPGGRACFSCPMRCKRYGRVADGPYKGTFGKIEFEGIGSLGSKCAVDDLAAVFHGNMLANDYGMDVISLGSVIALFMELHEAGILSHGELDGVDLHFGDSEAMIEAINRIGMRRGRLGELGSLGSFKAARRISPEALKYDSSTKGLDTINVDPRVAKGFGFGYAVASRGSDHMRANPSFELMRMPPEVAIEMFGSHEAASTRTYGGKSKMVAWHEDLAAAVDSLGCCRFMSAILYANYPFPELLNKYKGKPEKPKSIKYHEWLSAAAGTEVSYEELMGAGRRIVNMERAINLRLGVRKKDDTLAPRFFHGPVAEGVAKGETFSRPEFDSMLDEYYEIRGWDKSSGLMKASTLHDLGMGEVAPVLHAEGLLC